EFAYADAQLAAAADELAADPYLHRLLVAAEPAPEPLEPAAAVEAAARQVQLGIELVQMRAQPLLDPRPLDDQILTMIEQQPDLARATLQHRHRQLALAQRRPRHGKRVDRVRFAALTCRAPRARHQ